MAPDNQYHQGRDVDATEKQFFTSQIEAVQKSIESLESHMTKLFNTKIDNQAEDIRELKTKTDTHDSDISTLKGFKEGHQEWHREHKGDRRFRLETFIALGAIIVAIAAIFWGG